jgi:hypothetical protein
VRKVRKLVPKILKCPVTKKECPLYDQSSGGGRSWCDDEGDPYTYEVCPIPSKAKKAEKAKKIEEGVAAGYPQFVMIVGKSGELHSAMHHEGSGVYHRDAGGWEFQAGIVDGKLAITRCFGNSELVGRLVVEVTQEVWREDNAGYLGEEESD